MAAFPTLLPLFAPFPNTQLFDLLSLRLANYPFRRCSIPFHSSRLGPLDWSVTLQQDIHWIDSPAVAKPGQIFLRHPSRDKISACHSLLILQAKAFLEDGKRVGWRVTLCLWANRLRWGFLHSLLTTHAAPLESIKSSKLRLTQLRQVCHRLIRQYFNMRSGKPLVKVLKSAISLGDNFT